MFYSFNCVPVLDKTTATIQNRTEQNRSVPRDLAPAPASKSVKPCVSIPMIGKSSTFQKPSWKTPKSSSNKKNRQILLKNISCTVYIIETKGLLGCTWNTLKVEGKEFSLTWILYTINGGSSLRIFFLTLTFGKLVLPKEDRIYNYLRLN